MPASRSRICTPQATAGPTTRGSLDMNMAFVRAGGGTPAPLHWPSVVRLLEMLEPHASARIYDLCCGSGEMFVQSETVVEEHCGRRGSVSIYRQELNHTTWLMCQMNLAIRGIEGHIERG